MPQVVDGSRKDAAQRQLLGAAATSGLAVRTACTAEDDGSICKGSGAAANVYSVSFFLLHVDARCIMGHRASAGDHVPLHIQKS